MGSIRQHARMVWLTSGLFLAIGLLYAVAKPATYTASTLLLVYNRQISNTRDPVVLPGAADIPLVQNQIEMLQSGNVLTNVIASLGLDKNRQQPTQSFLHRLLSGFSGAARPKADAETTRTLLLESLRRHLRAVRVGASHAVLVSFAAADPDLAARVVNQIARSYLHETSLAWDAGPSGAPALRERYRSLGPSAFVVSPAEPPIRPDGPPPSVFGLGAALAGLAFGAAAALLLDFFNTTIRSPDQVEKILGLASLGLVPRVGDATVRTDKPHRPAATPARGRPLPLSGLGAYPLRSSAVRRAAAIMQDCSLHAVRSLGVTSTVAGEGATTFAISLAQSVAGAGRRVLLIDAVPEDPSVSRWAAAEARPTLAQASGRDDSPALQGVIEARNGLHVLPLAARIRGDAYSVGPELLDASVRAALGSYDSVIVDMPSLVSGPDVRAATHILDGFVLVVKWGDTDSDLIDQSLQSTGEAQSRFVGAVLNMADLRALKRYGCRSAAETDAVPRYLLLKA